MRDFRIENALFWPHMRNGSYEAFFEQSTNTVVDPGDTDVIAASMWEIEREIIAHPILKLEYDVSRVLAEMEVAGVYIDHEALKSLEIQLMQTIETIEKKIQKVIDTTYETDKTNETPQTVNLASPQQLQKLLFETMKIKPIKKTKTGWSTDEETLAILARDHEICQDIITHRQASKLLGTYVRGLTKHINPKTKRLHTSYDTLGAATGRLSSNDPNLQNIPAGNEWADKIKEAFQPQESGWSYVVADYSQIELRILACLSGDHQMITTLQEKKDLHVETAKALFGKETVTKEERSMAKTVNFGVMYGITPFGLSKMLPKPPNECGEYIKRFFTLYPETRKYFDHVTEEAKRVGYAETYFGRRRTIKGITDSNSMVREAAKREAMNMPIQGTCADIIKYAMVKISAEFAKKGFKGRLLMQVHDELVAECPDDEAKKMRTTMKDIMEHIVEWDVPMIAEVGVGKNWLEAKK